MATLHIFYDLDSKTISKASTDGHTIPGVSSVVLEKGRVSLLDVDGRDLLAGGPKNAKLQMGIAEMLGYEGTGSGQEDDDGEEKEPTTDKTTVLMAEFADIQAKIAEALGGQS